MTTEKQFTKTEIFILAIFSICGIILLTLFFKGCDKDPVPPQPESTLQLQNTKLSIQAKYWQNEANKYRFKANVIKDTIPYYVKRYSGYYDSVIVVSADTCKPVLRRYKRMRDTTDSLLMWQINWQDSALTAQDSVIRLKNGQIKNDTIILAKSHKALSDTVKYFNKKIRRTKLKWFGIGFGTGAAADRIGITINSLKK